MKRNFLFLIGWALLVQMGLAAGNPQAVLHKIDGRAWRIFLIENKGDSLVIRLNKSKANTTTEIEEIDRLEIEYPEYDAALVQEQFNQADYAAVIAALEPVAAPVADYMGIPNNLQDAFGLLVRAYHWNGDLEKAKTAADQLMGSQNPELKILAQVIRSLSALTEDDLSIAKALQGKMDNPVAQLYTRACIEQTEGTPVRSIQTVVEMIAAHPNDKDWLPSAELLCAELYLEMGLTNSAEATARQTQLFYAGMNVEKEAQALRSTINESIEKSE